MKQRFPTIKEGYKCQARERQEAFGPVTRSEQVDSGGEFNGAKWCLICMFSFSMLWLLVHYIYFEVQSKVCTYWTL